MPRKNKSEYHRYETMRATELAKKIIRHKKAMSHFPKSLQQEICDLADGSYFKKKYISLHCDCLTYWREKMVNPNKEKWVSARICQATYDKLVAAKNYAGAASWSAILKTILDTVAESGIDKRIDGDHEKEPKRFIRIPESLVKAFEKIEPGENIDDKIYLATCSYLKAKRRS